MIKHNNKTEFQNDEEYLSFLNWAFNLEKEWRVSLPRFTTQELLKIFPEVKYIVQPKLKELNEHRKQLVEQIKSLLLQNRKIKDQVKRDLGKYLIQLSFGKELLKIDKQIFLFKHYASVAKGRPPSSGGVTDEEVEIALRVPIENITEQKLRRAGNKLVGLCPFHNEQTPSFTIYPETNSFYCFGCNKGGNSINYVMLLNEYGFVEAVKYLINQKI